jgi:hypothetical protein
MADADSEDLHPLAKSELGMSRTLLSPTRRAQLPAREPPRAPPLHAKPIRVLSPAPSVKLLSARELARAPPTLNHPARVLLRAPLMMMIRDPMKKSSGNSHARTLDSLRGNHSTAPMLYQKKEKQWKLKMTLSQLRFNNSVRS